MKCLIEGRMICRTIYLALSILLILGSTVTVYANTGTSTDMMDKNSAEQPIVRKLDCVLSGQKDSADSLTTELSLDFSLESQKEAESFTLEAPKEGLKIADQKTAVPVYAGDISEKGMETAALSDEKIGDYTIKDGKIQVVFDENLKSKERHAFFGRIVLKAQYDRKALSHEPREITWDLWDESTRQAYGNEMGEMFRKEVGGADEKIPGTVIVKLPAQKALDWSKRGEDFSFEISEGNELHFGFLNDAPSTAVMAGDTAVCELENSGYTVAATEEDQLVLGSGEAEQLPVASWVSDGKKILLTFTKTAQSIEKATDISGSIILEKTAVPATILASNTSLGDFTADGVSYQIEGQSSEKFEQNIFWIDNNNAKDIRPDKLDEVKKWLAPNDPQTSGEGVTAKATVVFKRTDALEGDETATVQKDLQIPLRELVDINNDVTLAEGGGTGTWHFSIANLPTQLSFEMEDPDETGKRIIYMAEDIRWDLVPRAEQTREAPEGTVGITDLDEYYFPTDINSEEDYERYPGANPDNGGLGLGWYYSEAMDFHVDVEVRRGDHQIYGIDKAVGQQYHFYVDTGREAGKVDLPLNSDAIHSSWGTWQYGDTPGRNTFSVSHLPKYNLDATEIDYYIDQPKGEDGKSPNRIDQVIVTEEDIPAGVTDVSPGDDRLPGEDYLLETVENNPVYNHGTDAEHAHDGGKIILTLKGYTQYGATKEWHDQDDPSQRPDLKFELWRYAVRPNQDPATAYQKATPVKIENNVASVEIKGKSQEDRTFFDFKTLYANEKDQTDEGYLPKYDAEGYPYVYFTRESMTSSGADCYESRFYPVDALGNPGEDTLPEGIGVDGREANDKSIYNGGTVSNILTGNTTAEAQKTWNAMAFQTELGDVRIQLTLQSRPAREGQGPNENWKNTEEVRELSGFIAEMLEQSLSANMPKYNELGERLEYRWIESGVFQEGSETNLLAWDATTGLGEFTLQQKGESVKYTSNVKVESDDKGNYETVIENNIENTTQYRVTKRWLEGVNNIQPLELILYRTNASMEQQKLTTKDGKNFSIDGNADTEWTDLYFEGNPVGRVMETEEWYAEYEGLVKYDDHGNLYEYVILEKATQGGAWDTKYETTIDEDNVRHLHIENGPGDGEIYRIRLRKSWLDDSDRSHREPVTFSFYKRTEENGTVKFDKLDGQIAPVVVSESDDWWKEIKIQTSVVEEEDLLVLETKVGEKPVGDGTLNAPNDQYQTKYTPEYMEEVWRIQHADSSAKEKSDYMLFEAANHYYNASYSLVEIEGVPFYTVSNLRLGRIDMTAEKDWIDGNDKAKREALLESVKSAVGKKETDSKNYVLGLKLECVDAPEAIDYKTNIITLGGTPMPISDAEGRVAGAIQPIDTEQSNQSLSFYNLPKYNEFGQMVRYRVVEVAYDPEDFQENGCYDVSKVYPLAELELENNEYSFGVSQVSYVPGTDHTVDTQVYSVTNRLSGSKDVLFRKEWKDAYRYEAGERPDIYFDLYRQIHVTSEEGQVVEKIESIYKDTVWRFEGQNTPNYSTTILEKMPKYDELGYEIIYYAREKTHIDKEMFDYDAVQYKYPENTVTTMDVNVFRDIDRYKAIGTEFAVDSDNQDKVVKLTEDLDPEVVQKNEVYALKEGGLFVNQISADVKIAGKKIWSNTPAGFSKTDLPNVEFSLYQYHTDDENIPQDGEVIPQGKDAVATLEVSDWENHYANGEYQFVFGYEGKNINSGKIDEGLVVFPEEATAKPLSKYDEVGKLYTYVLRENLSGIYQESSENGLTEEQENNLVYQQPKQNNYIITNVYDSAKGSINIRKWLDLTKYTGEQNLPAVSFTLTRAYLDKEGGWVNEKGFSQTKTIKPNEFEKINFDKQYKGETSFDNLEIYAPNGSYYKYIVTENTGGPIIQGGYTMVGGNGALEMEDNDNYKEIAEENKVIVSGLIAQKKDEGTAAFFESISQKILGLFRAEDRGANSSSRDWATFKNTFNNMEKGNLSLIKRWEDRNNIPGVRPKELTFDIYRSANAQSGGAAAIGEIKLGQVKLTIPEDKWKQPSAEGVMADILENDANQQEMLKKIFGDNDENIFVKIETVDSQGKPKTENASLSGAAAADGFNYWKITFENVNEVFATTGVPWTYTFKEVTESGDMLPDNVYKARDKEAKCSYAGYDTGNDKHVFSGGTDYVINKMTIQILMNKKVPASPGESYSASNAVVNSTGYTIKVGAQIYVAGTTNLNDKSALYIPENWKPIGEEESASPYSEQIMKTHYGKADINQNEKKQFCNPEHTVNKGASLSFGNFGSSNLPRAINYTDDSGKQKTVYLSYVVVETKLELLDENKKVIYQESYTPQFVKLDKNGKAPEMGYWLEQETKIKSTPEEILEELPANTAPLFKPFFDTREKLENYYNNGAGAVGLNGNSNLQPYINLDLKANGSDTTYMYNITDLVNLEVIKTWENDHDNIYGTREQNGPNAWELDFQIEQADKADNQWSPFAYNGVDSKLTLAGNNSEATKSQKISNLLKHSLKQHEDGGYSLEEYQYRARELNPEAGPVDEHIGKYNFVYNVDYQDSFNTDENIYRTSVTNTMITSEIYAEKNWVQEGLEKPVTFELQYQKPDGSWQAFTPAANVVLDGTVDPEAVYYEYDAWRAKWTSVPVTMPSSKMDENGKTIYRIIEYTDDSYEVSDAEKEGQNYFKEVTAQQGTEDNPLCFKNQLTELVVKKIVSKNGGDIEDGVLSADHNTSFNLVLMTKGQTETTYSCRIFNENGVLEEEKSLESVKEDFLTEDTLKDYGKPVQNRKAVFTLKDGWTAKIYGLKKNQEYWVQEEDTNESWAAWEGWREPLYNYWYGEDAGSQTGSATLKELMDDMTWKHAITMPDQPLKQEFIVTNRNSGSIILEKKDNKRKPLAGVAFRLEYKNKNGEWLDIDNHVCGNTAVIEDNQGNIDENNAPGILTDQDGRAAFTNLALDQEYRITEISTQEGYNLLAEPVLVKLAYETASGQIGNGKSLFYTKDGKNYYKDIIITIENNQTLVMPETAGNGFFWPGMAGMTVIFGTVGAILVKKERERRKLQP